jgi:hypothetical protein
VADHVPRDQQSRDEEPQDAPNVKVLVGDFNGDGRTDIALIGGTGWQSIPVAFSNGDGTFTVTNYNAGDFASWHRNRPSPR